MGSQSVASAAFRLHDRFAVYERPRCVFAADDLDGEVTKAIGVSVEILRESTSPILIERSSFHGYYACKQGGDAGRRIRRPQGLPSLVDSRRPLSRNTSSNRLPFAPSRITTLATE